VRRRIYRVGLLSSLALLSLIWGKPKLPWITFLYGPENRNKNWEISMERSDWREVFNGYGSNRFGTKEGIILEPHPAQMPNETHSNLILVKRTEDHPLKDFLLTAQIATERQLRTPQPNPWEVLWIFFNCHPDQNGVLKTNYFMIKPNGIEFGKAFDHVKQSILYTQPEPRLIFGKAYSVTLIKIGKHIDLLIDGIPIKNAIHRNLSILDTPGAIGIYTEDARSHLYNLVILPLNFNKNS